MIHSFWAYQLSIKADANPQVDNVAFTTTNHTGSVTVRCSELCGLWHGAMFNYGQVVSKSGLRELGDGHREGHRRQHQAAAAVRLDLRPRRQRGGRRVLPGNVDPYSPSEVYGAKQPAS